MKKITILLVLALASLSASAQFSQGKGYVGASLTGLNMSYSGSSKFSLGLEAKAGIFFADNWMALGAIGYNHSGAEGVHDTFSAQVGARYYIVQNGLFLGLGAKYNHAKHYNDLMPGAEVGYAFFINRSVTLEPAVYYDHSFKNSDFSTVGLKVGVGVYLFDD